MRAIDVSDFLADPSRVLDSVSADRDEVIVTRSGGDAVVILALDDYSALQETAHLLRSPANTARITRAMDRLER